MTPQVSDQIQLVLDHHPVLRLTPWQRDLFELSRERTRGWQNQLARNRGKNRQSITNTLRVIRRKTEAARDIVRLADGDIVPVFSKYSTGWATEPIRRLLWDALRPKYGVQMNQELRQMLSPIQEALVREALHLLEAQLGGKQRARLLESQPLVFAYNMLISAAHIKPDRSDFVRLLEGFASTARTRSWLVYRFARRALHLFDHQACVEHRQWLKAKIASPDEEARRFATYAVTYYGGTDALTAQRYLTSDGTLLLAHYSYKPVLARLYTNIQIPRYDSPLWDDINFLRIALMVQHLPLRPSAVPPSSRNTLQTLCQRALHSTDSFVVREAERLLAGLP